MRSKSLAATIVQFLAVTLAFLSHVSTAQAGEKVMFHLNNQACYPASGLILDSAGNLYGTTDGCGTANWGTVFELSPGSNGTWAEAVLYSFQGGKGGVSPYGTLAMDKEGNLYGTAQTVDFNLSGVIFKLTKGSTGTWSYSVIHNFSPNEGGPNGDLTWDGSGNLYGTTEAEFVSIGGEVFKLSPQANGSWKETVLYAFPGSTGVRFPVAGVIFDTKGNLYGPTFYGEGNRNGAVYELSPNGSGQWTLTVLYSFSGGGSEPNSRLTFDSNGNLFGTALLPGDGQVYELSPVSGGPWTKTTIHAFTSGSDGTSPVGPLVVDASGNLYGATYRGGNGCNKNLCGLVYKFSQSGGTWKETILHPFESADDGSQPGAGLLIDSAGNLYGTTINGGGRFGYGTVYEITP